MKGVHNRAVDQSPTPLACEAVAAGQHDGARSVLQAVLPVPLVEAARLVRGELAPA